MVPRIDLNLVQQPDSDDEAEVLETAAEKNVTAEQTQQRAVSSSPESTITDDDQATIPFRTSKRLQGAIYRMIQQRDGKCHDSNVPATKDRHSAGAPAPPSRRGKRKQEIPSQEQIDAKCKSEDKETPAGVDMVKVLVGCDIVKSGGSVNKKRKRFTVHFAEPLVAYIGDARGDEEEVASKQLLSLSKCDSVSARRTEETPVLLSAAKKSTLRATEVHRKQRSPPMSCFDLLCSHVGPRGWRCYRSSVEGMSFCRFHENRKTMSFERGISQVVHI